MQEYFTPDVTYGFLRHCEKWGLNTSIIYWGKKPLATLGCSVRRGRPCPGRSTSAT
jgi:hypothetical protein